MGVGIGYISLGPQHLVHQNYRVHPISSLVWRRSHHTRKLKLGSFRTEIAATALIQRYVELGVVENAKLQAASNLDKYHQETKTWRDKKVL